MKILSLATLTFLLTAGSAYCQNLVPNPSFEEYEDCPYTLSLIDAPMGTLSVTDWYRPTESTSDYFNSCASSATMVSVPDNFAGYQMARTGEGYAGWYGYGWGYREYVEAKLLTPLITGHNYYVGYWVVLATTYTSFAIDQMGAVFSEDSLYDPSIIGYLPETPQIVSPVDVIYKDTADWELVSGTFTAGGGERWVTIGNFTPDADINTEPVGEGSSGYAYYYLDDVCIFDMDSAAPENIDIHDTVSCDEDELLLEGRAGMDNFLWDDGSTGATRTISLTGTYWVRSVDKENCRMLVDTFHVRVGAPVEPFNIGNDTVLCFATDITLMPDIMPEFGIFTWSDGSHGTSLDVTGAGTYWLEVKNGCYSYSDTVKIVIAPASLFMVTNDTLVCEGAEVPVMALGSPLYSYQWIPEDGVSDPHSLTPIITVTENSEYLLKGTFEGCPDTIVAISFQAEPVPSVTLRSDTTVCQGTTITLEPVITPAFSDYTYTWSPDEGLLDPGQVNNYFIADTSVTYYFKVNTPSGCSGMDSVHITVYPVMFPSVIADTGVCPGESVMLWASGGKDYNWFPAYGLDSTGIATPTATPETSTQYGVYITDKNGCSDTLTVDIAVYPEAVVSLEDSVNIWPGESYELNPQGNCAYFQWFPPSGLSSANIANPIASPEVRTRYFLTASTEHGCTLRDSIDILVNTESIFDLPNAFVPGNGKNNIFKISRRGNITLKRFQVFNRWGNLVFETTNIDEGWDGSFNGTPQPTGVYLYSIEAVTNTGRPVNKQGNVTLIR